MESERWKRLEELFEAATAVPTESRSAWIEEKCGSDHDLAREVAGLAEADDQIVESDFISSAVEGAAHSLVAQEESGRIGERVGAYRLVGEVGHGGMGTVYLAERDDEHYEATVAIKFVRGALASPDLLERLRRERQILADLAHENIARLLDGGAAPDGTPYLVMEYIEGEPIDVHCESRELQVRDRVRLIRRVATAVHHAHEARVVHRDIKPSNILVTTDGTPKLVDFGIAKILDLDASSERNKTTTLVRVTPAYASPEQLREERATATTDVYSLGVVLYELLAGRPPFEPGELSFGELERRICEEEPRRPSAIGGRTRASTIARDLDTIVLKAIRKEPEERYASAAELAEDLGRWLDGQPVTARPATLGYRAGKFVRRHRASVVSAAAVVLVSALAGALLFSPSPLDPTSSSDARPQVTRLVVLPFEDLSEAGEQQFLAAGITEELLNALTRIAQLEVIGRASSLHVRAASLDVRAIGEQLEVGLVVGGSVRRDGERIRVRAQLIDVATGSQRWSDVYERQLDDLFTLQEEAALAIAEELRLELSGSTRQRLRKHVTERGDAYELYLRGRYEWAQRTESGIWNAIEAFRTAIAADPEFALAYAGLADAYRLLPAYGNVSGPEALRQSKTAALRAVELDDALPEAHTALAASIIEVDLDRAAAAREYQRAIELNPREATALRWYGLHLAGDGEFDAALRYVERARRIDPLSPVAIGSIGTVNYFARRPEEAIEAFHDALSLRPEWATGHAVLGRIYLMAGRTEEAIAEMEQAVAISGGEANDRALLATAYAMDGREREARSIARELASTSDGFLPAAGLAGIYIALGEPETALDWLRRAIELRDTDLKYLKVDPRFDPLMGRPEFEAILESVGLL